MARSLTYNRFTQAFDPTKRRADEAQDFYLGEATSFDPTEAVSRYGQAAFGDLERQLDRKMESLRR